VISLLEPAHDRGSIKSRSFHGEEYNTYRSLQLTSALPERETTSS
jgi:hypothetical protein